MIHASKVVLDDLEKFDPKIRANVKRVSSADTSSTDVKGSARRVPFIDQAAKIAPPSTDPLPAREMPTSSGKPKAYWPRNPITTSSGRAVPGAIGTRPSTDTPSR
jgi:hypothetical protein